MITEWMSIIAVPVTEVGRSAAEALLYTLACIAFPVGLLYFLGKKEVIDRVDT